MSQVIGMIGVGNMASAIANAIHRALPNTELLLNTRTPSRIHTLSKELGARIVNKETVVQESDVIFIGVKPKQFNKLFEELSGYIDREQPIIWISMAAGLSLEYLKHLTPPSHPWIRIMPNTPVEVGKGVIGYVPSDNVDQNIIEDFELMLSEAGLVQPLEESQFDALTGLAGSSPAFIYQLIEAMSDVGVQYGLNRQQSIEFAASAVEGAASMVLHTGKHPAELKDAVTSPSGTTIEGVIALEHNGFRSAIIQGVATAIEKSKDMSN